MKMILKIVILLVSLTVIVPCFVAGVLFNLISNSFTNGTESKAMSNFLKGKSEK